MSGHPDAGSFPPGVAANRIDRTHAGNKVIRITSPLMKNPLSLEFYLNERNRAITWPMVFESGSESMFT